MTRDEAENVISGYVDLVSRLLGRVDVTATDDEFEVLKAAEIERLAQAETRRAAAAKAQREAEERAALAALKAKYERD